MDVDMAAAAIAIDDEAVMIVSETDAAEVQSHSSSSSSSLGEDRGQRSSSTWLSLSSNPMQRQRQQPYEDDSSDDNSDDTDDMKDESAEMGSNQNQDDLYCEHMDDDDEAWVYQHMRGGSDKREDLMHARIPQHRLQQRSNSENTAEKYEHSHHAKKLRGFEHESSAGHDTDGNGSVPFKSESNFENPLDSDMEQYQQCQQQPPQQQQHDQETHTPNQSMHQRLQQHQASAMAHLKPRSSDAVLSCPSCFNIVCMDCQQHEKYANQYRAMFVMNIGVDWNRKMVYDDAMGCLKLMSEGSACDVADAVIAAGGEVFGDRRGEENILAENDDEDNIHFQLGGGVSVPDRIPEEPKNDTREDKGQEFDSFYSVHCSYCRCEVAALDMKDEIYYFFGCIASA